MNLNAQCRQKWEVQCLSLSEELLHNNVVHHLSLLKCRLQHSDYSLITLFLANAAKFVHKS